MADTEDKIVITAEELIFEMDVTKESINLGNRDNLIKNFDDGARIISDFVSGSVELDAEALEKMSEYIDFYLGTDPKNEEAKKLRDEAVAKVATLKEQNVAKAQAAEKAKEGEENSETGGEEGQDSAEPQDSQEDAGETAQTTPEEQEAFANKVDEIDAIAEANPLIDENGKFSWMAKWAGPNGLSMVETNHPDMEELNAFYENIVDEKKQKHEGLQSDVYELALATTKHELAEMEGWEALSEEEKARTFQRTLANNLTANTYSFVLTQEDANKGLDPKEMTKPVPERMAEAKGIISKFATDKSKPYMISNNVLAVAKVVQVADVEQRAQKLSERFNNSKPVQWIKKVDNRLTKKWPTLYPAVKQFAKGYAITGSIAALTGPAGLAVYAGYNVYKQVKAMKDQANTHNQTFWQFMKKNKSQAGMLVLSVASASMSAIVGIDALGNTQAGQWLGDGIRTVGENFANTQVGDWLSGKTEGLRDALPSWDNLRDYAVERKASLGKWQGIAAMGKTFSEERKKGNGVWKSLAIASARGFGTLVAVGKGLGAHESMVSAIDGLGGDDVNAAEPVNKAPEMVDADNDGIPDMVDIDRGEGWATANQTQIDRLFDANPKAVNEILGGEWQSSAELHEMLENNQIGEEQLKSIHALAGAQFDENGKIIDPELNQFYQEKLDQIKAGQAIAAEQQRHEEYGIEELKVKVTPLEVEPLEPIEIKAPEVKVPNGTLEARMDVDGDGKVDDVTIINQDGQRVVATEYGGRGGRAEVSITDSEGNTVTVNNETLQQDGATKGEARRAMNVFVEQANAGLYNNVNPETMKNASGFEFTEATKGDATLETEATETPTVEGQEQQGTPETPVVEGQGGAGTPTTLETPTTSTVDGKETPETPTVPMNNENGPATRTWYDSNNKIICAEVQNENGVWVDANEEQAEPNKEVKTETNVSDNVTLTESNIPSNDAPPSLYAAQQQQQLNDELKNSAQGKDTASLVRNLQMGKNINLSGTTQATAHNAPTKLDMAQVMAATRGNDKV